MIALRIRPSGHTVGACGPVSPSPPSRSAYSCVAPASSAAIATTSAKAKTCNGAKVPVTVGKKTTCKPLGKAIPKPKAMDLRLAHLQEALTQDPAKMVKGKKRKRLRTLQSGFGAAGKRLQKKLLRSLPKALAVIDRVGGAGPSHLSGGLAQASAGCDIGPAGPIGQTGGNSVGALGENGGYINASAGGGIRVRVTFVSCRGASNFRLPQCPTANGSVDGKATGEFRATVEVWNGNELVSRNSSTFEEKAKAHGEVGPDAKLKFIDVEHTQEVFIVASGGVVIRGGVTRKVRIAMPGGKYDPAAASVRFYGDSIAANSGADAFASTAASALGAYQDAEPRWSTFNPSGGYCAEPVFSPESDTLKLKKGDSKQLSIYAKAQDGGRATAARWTLLGAENADFSPTSSEAPAPTVSYTVTHAPNGGQVKVTAKFTSTAGVGEKSWTQPTESDSIDEISGIFTSRFEVGGSVLEWAGNATFLRYSPAIFSPPEGVFKLANGLYTFTMSGKATYPGITDQCSMKGGGQFALNKESSFDVFSSGFNEEPPYSYGFSIGSEGFGSELPMIEIEIFNCSEPAKELEGDRFPYPATMSLFTAEPHTSEDGLVYAETVTVEQSGVKQTDTWHFRSQTLTGAWREGLLVARGDAEDRDDLGVVRLRVDDVGAGTAAEPTGGFVVADEDAGMVLAAAVLDPDRVALLESVFRVAHRANPNR